VAARPMASFALVSVASPSTFAQPALNARVWQPARPAWATLDTGLLAWTTATILGASTGCWHHSRLLWLGYWGWGKGRILWRRVMGPHVGFYGGC